MLDLKKILKWVGISAGIIVFFFAVRYGWNKYSEKREAEQAKQATTQVTAEAEVPSGPMTIQTPVLDSVLLGKGKAAMTNVEMPKGGMTPVLIINGNLQDIQSPLINIEQGRIDQRGDAPTTIHGVPAEKISSKEISLLFEEWILQYQKNADPNTKQEKGTSWFDKSVPGGLVALNDNAPKKQAYDFGD